METTTFSQALSSPALLAVSDALRDLLGDEPQAQAVLERCLAIAQLVAALEPDPAVVVGAALAPLLEEALLSPEQAAVLAGTPALKFAHELQQLGSFDLSSRWQPEQRLTATQAEALRRMLLAAVVDPRLVLVRLAEQLWRLRNAKDDSEADRRRLALQARDVYAPLANRLGLGLLKWELEDLAFRHLDADSYRQIAGSLNERRTDREKYIADLQVLLARELEHAGVQAEIQGRPKHIYSIHRKMQQKQLAFEQVFDVRAVRLLVASVAECYAALGVVHGLWPYVAGEFDDYIATPKSNGYRSIHTAVIGPGGKPLEVQIRTHGMHAASELGVAAHWRYKEGGSRDSAYELKLERLRQMLSPGQRAAPDDFLERIQASLFEDRIYVLSPKGDVIELPAGATPLDFAYQVHTDLGHRCRGAKVGGRMVSLDYQLKSGETVEIITARQARPSRDWLVERLGFLQSKSSRAKVRSWFRRQDVELNRREGRELLEHELARSGHTDAVTLPDLVGEFRATSAEDLYRLIGEGEVTAAQIAGAIQRRVRLGEEGQPAPVRSSTTAIAPTAGGLRIMGVDDLMSQFARCCRPVPPEPVVGYVTVGRGVTIHRENCRNLARLRERQPDRVLRVDWGNNSERTYPVDIAVRALDRRGLVRDISAVFADEKLSIDRINTLSHTAEGTADLSIGLRVHSLVELDQAMARIVGLPNVLSVRRRT